MKPEEIPILVRHIKQNDAQNHYARAFIAWKTNNPEQCNQDDPLLFQLGQWFWNQNNIRNHHLLAVSSFAQCFDEYIPGGITHEQLLALGNAFVSDPIQFSGYLFWLLQRQVSYEDILDSQLLRKFFGFHICDISTITNTYHIFYALSDETRNFIKRFENIACQLRGFINTELLSGRYQSYNYFGNTFEHDECRFYFSDNVGNDLEIKPISCGVVRKHFGGLFHLFGWDFIRLLNLELLGSQNIIARLLSLDSSQERFLKLYHQQVLNGELSLEGIITINKIIEGGNWLYSIETIQSMPFLIHTQTQSEQFQLQVNATLPLLIRDERYHFPAHIFFLCELYNSKISDKQKKDIVELIFKITLSNTLTISDEIQTQISFHIYGAYQAHCVVYVTEFSALYHSLVSDYLSGKGGFDVILHEWGSHLTMMNFIFEFYSNLQDGIPKNKLGICTDIVDRINHDLNPKNRTHHLIKLLNEFNHDPSYQTKLIITLCQIEKYEHFVCDILNYAFEKNSDFFKSIDVCILLNKVYSCHKNIFHLLAESDHVALSKKIFTVLKKKLKGMLNTKDSNGQKPGERQLNRAAAKLICEQRIDLNSPSILSNLFDHRKRQRDTDDATNERSPSLS